MTPEIKEIVQRLIEKTKKKQVKWHRAADILNESDDDWDYAVSTSNSTINIFRYFHANENGKLIYGIRLNIINNRGTVIHSELILTNEPDYELLNELLELARGRVMNLDETLKKLKEELNDDSVLGDNDIPF